MLSFNVRGSRAAIQNLRPPPRRWLSGRPFRAHSNNNNNSPRSRRDDDFGHERRRPSARHDDVSDRGLRGSRWRDGGSGSSSRFSSPRAGPPQTGRSSSSSSSSSSRFSSPRAGPPQTGRRLPPRTPPPEAPRLALMPKLPEEEQDKIGTAQEIWEARSLYFTLPKRPPKPKARPQPPPQQQQPRKPPRRGGRHEAAIPTTSSIKAAILNMSEEQFLNGGVAPRAQEPQEPEQLSILDGVDGGTLSASPARDLAHAQAAKFFISPPPAFLYSAFSFRHHPLNTTTPEVCVIGASNCGKSSFVNALTASPGDALAKVSERAGKTVSMNAYGVGPLAHYRAALPPRPVLSHARAGERPAEHAMVLVDTPGYGFASHGEWGREIEGYMRQRTMLRGVVLLLSAEKRVSARDAQVLGLLADVGKPVVVVFTKMDKVLRQKKRREEGGVAERLREVERCLAATGWDGWAPRIHLTAARMRRDKDWTADPTRSAAGMAGVRMAVLELAGLKKFIAPEKPEAAAAAKARRSAKKEEEEEKQVEKAESKRQEPGKALESDPAAWSGDIISFEELEKKFGDWSS